MVIECGPIKDTSVVESTTLVPSKLKYDDADVGEKVTTLGPQTVGVA
jgi:hypothetical protein